MMVRICVLVLHFVYICPLQLVEACRTGDVRAVQQLLSRGVGVNDEYEEVCTCIC